MRFLIFFSLVWIPVGVLVFAISEVKDPPYLVLAVLVGFTPHPILFSVLVPDLANLEFHHCYFSSCVYINLICMHKGFLIFRIHHSIHLREINPLTSWSLPYPPPLIVRLHSLLTAIRFASHYRTTSLTLPYDLFGTTVRPPRHYHTILSWQPYAQSPSPYDLCSTTVRLHHRTTLLLHCHTCDLASLLCSGCKCILEGGTVWPIKWGNHRILQEKSWHY